MVKDLGGRKMKHFSIEEWVDFVNQVTSADQRRAMEGHLAHCKSCQENMDLWQRVRRQAAVEASYQPPAHAVRQVKAAFAVSGLAARPKRSRGLVQVLFDSFAQPALAGARSAGLGTRQMLYRADPYQVDIHVESKPASNRLVVTGQLLDISQPGTHGRDVQVTLSNRRGNSVLAATNQFGEFSGEIENSGDLELSIPGQGAKPIVISLRNALGKLPGGRG
jgi:hypothetical protein